MFSPAPHASNIMADSTQSESGFRKTRRVFPSRTLPFWEHFPLSWKIPVHDIGNQYALKSLGEKKTKDLRGDFDTTMAPQEILEYKPENDPHLQNYFKKAETRRHLVDQGLVTSDGKVPLSLKEFNMYRQYQHERNRRRALRNNETKVNVLFGRKASLFDEHKFLIERRKAMLNLLEELNSMRRKIAINEAHLRQTQDEYNSLVEVDGYNEDRLLELGLEVERRTKQLGKKWQEFEDFLTYLENLEEVFLDQYEDRRMDEKRALQHKDKRFKLRVYLQSLCKEEENFKRAVLEFETLRRTDKRLDLSQAEHEELMNSVYNKLVSLRMGRKAAEQDKVFQLMQKMAEKMDGSTTSLKSIDASSLSLNSLEDAELQDFMARIISINHSPNNKLEQDHLDKQQRKKLLSTDRYTRSADPKTNTQDLWIDFLNRAAPTIANESARTMAKRIALRRLTHNFEQPFKNVLYGRKPYKAPGVSEISSELMHRQKSNQPSLGTLSRHYVDKKAKYDHNSPNKASYFSQKAHTCESYVALLQLRVKQIRQGDKKPRNFSVDQWLINDPTEKLQDLRASAKIQFQAKPRQLISAENLSSDSVKSELDFSVYQRFLPGWIRPPHSQTNTTEKCSTTAGSVANKTARGDGQRYTKKKPSMDFRDGISIDNANIKTHHRGYAHSTASSQSVKNEIRRFLVKKRREQHPQQQKITTWEQPQQKVAA